MQGTHRTHRYLKKTPVNGRCWIGRLNLEAMVKATSRAMGIYEIGIPGEADVYLCGPTRFTADMKDVLVALGLAPHRTSMSMHCANCFGIAIRQLSLADACMVRLSEIHERFAILALDSDFLAYRKHRRISLTFIHPLAR